MNKCIRCGGILRSSKVEIHRRWGDQWYIVRDVPANVCEDCGEEYYHAKVLMQIDEMRDEILNSPEHTEIPTADFPQHGKAA